MTHVIVVGSGIAGLSAALSAAEAGARVTIVERAVEGEHGGNTRYTEAYLRMKSVDEVADDFVDHLAANAGGYTDPSIERRWCATMTNGHRSPEPNRWLILSCLPAWPNTLVPRCAGSNAAA